MSPRLPPAVRRVVSTGVQSMESVDSASGLEAGGGVRVGTSAPPGCFQAWPPPSRHTGDAVQAQWRPGSGRRRSQPGKKFNDI